MLNGLTTTLSDYFRAKARDIYFNKLTTLQFDATPFLKTNADSQTSANGDPLAPRFLHHHMRTPLSVAYEAFMDDDPTNSMVGLKKLDAFGAQGREVIEPAIEDGQAIIERVQKALDHSVLNTFLSELALHPEKVSLKSYMTLCAMHREVKRARSELIELRKRTDRAVFANIPEDRVYPRPPLLGGNQ